MDAYLNPEELNRALMGATIIGFRALLNGRDILLETTAGSVLMTNELKYAFIPSADSRAETRKLEKVEKKSPANESPYSC